MSESIALTKPKHISPSEYNRLVKKFNKQFLLLQLCKDDARQTIMAHHLLKLAATVDHARTLLEPGIEKKFKITAISRPPKKPIKL